MEPQIAPTVADVAVTPKAGPRVDASGLTHPGRVRATNEDSYLIATLQRSMLVHDGSPAARGWFTGESAGTMLIVADGMGGQGGGDVASRVAVNAVVNHLLNCMPWATVSSKRVDSAGRQRSLTGVRDQLESAMVEGDSDVKVAGARSGTPRMGTTLTMALVLWPVAYVAHVGDTRCYLYRGGELKLLTTDHTLAQRIAEVSAEPIESTSHLHHILWNALGATEELPKPEIQKLTLEPNDVLLLCSDGLTKHLTDAQIAQMLSANGKVEQRCAMLVESANNAGGVDNITAIVAQMSAG